MDWWCQGYSSRARFRPYASVEKQNRFLNDRARTIYQSRPKKNMRTTLVSTEHDLLPSLRTDKTVNQRAVFPSC